MSTITRQPKGIPAGGQFATTAHTEPGIVLTGGQAEFVNDRHLFERELEAAAGPNAVLEDRYPSTKSEARRLLKNSRGEEGGRVRLVSLDYTNSPDTEPGNRVDVVGPKDGRPIVVDVTSGLPSLKVTSGKAIVRLRSGWGNAVDVGPGAEAVIIAPADAKVTVDCQEGGKVTFVCPTANNRGRLYGDGDIFVSFGTDTDRIRHKRPAREAF